MKRLYTIAFLHLTIIFCVSAQRQYKLYLGLEAGANYSYFDRHAAPYNKPQLVNDFTKDKQINFKAGVTADILTPAWVSFSSGILYTRRGSTYKTSVPSSYYLSSIGADQSIAIINYLQYRLDYVEVPFHINFNLFNLFQPNLRNKRLDLSLGLSGLFNVSSSLHYNLVESSHVHEERWKSYRIDQVKPIIITANLGLEWRKGRLTAGTQYSHTLTSPYDTSKTNESFDLSMSTISLSAGLWFGRIQRKRHQQYAKQSK